MFVFLLFLLLPHSLHTLKISKEFQKNIIIPESVKEEYMKYITKNAFKKNLYK
jgi:membrane-anchored glycerophosphoryl diester phosphodiesterase (GDPDase)